MRVRTIEGSAKHAALVNEIMDLIGKHKKEIDVAEILAVLSITVGRVVAMQDQRKYSPQAVMAIVARNIELGNQEVIEGLMKSEGQA